MKTKEKVLEAWKNGISFNEAMELMEKLTREDCEKDLNITLNHLDHYREQLSSILSKVEALKGIKDEGLPAKFGIPTSLKVKRFELVDKNEVIKIIREEK